MTPFKTLTYLLLFLACINIASALTAKTEIIGSGASYPYTFLKDAFKQSDKKHKIKFKYTPNGSKNGFFELKDKKVNFAVVDLFINDKLLATFPKNTEIIHIPVTLSGITIGTHVPGISDIKLTAQIFAEILIQKITNWKDPKIQELNTNLDLPDLEIIPIIRQGGSGSTFILTQYLSFMIPAWKNSYNVDPNLNIPGTLQAYNTQMMKKLLNQIPGSIGYLGFGSVENSDKFSIAHMENLKGDFIKPSLDSISLAATMKIPNDTRVSCIYTDTPNAYPLSSFSWLILDKELSNSFKSKRDAKKFKNFLKWITSDAQSNAKSLNYAPLPENVIKLSSINIDSLTFKTKKL